MLNIAIYNSNLNIGGIQKSLLALLHYLENKPVQIDLFLFGKIQTIEPVIPANVRVIYMRRFPVWMKLIPFTWVRKLKPTFEAGKAYDIAIDYNSYWHECAHGALTVDAEQRICWIHSDLKKRWEMNWKYRLLWLISRQKFKLFNSFAIVSKGAADAFVAMSGLTRENIVIVPSLLNEDEIESKSRQPVDFSTDPGRYNLISVGSMNYVKGYDIMVELMYQVVQKRQDVHLYIIGDGPSRKRVERLIKKKDLGEKITLLGTQRNPFPYLVQMDAYVTTSRYEGQGIAVMEALALGLDVFIPRHLESYLEGIPGHDNLADAIIAAKKRRIHYDIKSYNGLTRERLDQLLGL